MRRLLALGLLVCACDRRPDDLSDLAVVLVPPAGTGRIDELVAAAQHEVRSGRAVPASLERLGRLYVSQARLTQDPGHYKLAEMCANGIAARAPDHAGGRLLRGHVLHAMHRFAEAEVVARALVADRGTFADHGLLGDVLYDRGEVETALRHYQRMLDLEPCLQSYTRAAQVRWLRGDLDGARQLLQLAVGAGSTRDPESLCWTYARLALVELQAGDGATAATLCARALEIDPASVHVLLTRARVRAAAGDLAGAFADADEAARACPLPEHRWLAADLARACGDHARAGRLETELRRTGARDDPRHHALYLLSRGLEPARALALAEEEIASRRDVFTHDLHAWALLANGERDAAGAAIARALAQGTGDARIAYHAGAIAAARGDRDAAREHFAIATARRATLMPSERDDLARRAAQL